MEALHTERRRAVQPLWSALDAHVAPSLSGGVLLAVSGGSDSRALLEAAARWRRRDRGHLGVASVDHGIRPEARLEVDAVIARSRALGFEARPIYLAPVGDDEATLRAARYRALFDVARQMDCESICTAHHADDDAEGLLLDLLGLGGGRQGAAMAPVSTTPGGQLLRPFLGLPRATLAAARTALGALDVVSDPLDAAGVGNRALIRLRALPALRELRPGLEARLATKARRTAADEAALSALARAALEPLGNGLLIRRDQAAHISVARRAVEEGIRYMAKTQPDGAAQALSGSATSMAAVSEASLSEVPVSQEPAVIDPRRAGRTVDALLEAAGWGNSSRRLGRSFDLPGAIARVVEEGIQLSRAPPRGGMKS